MAAKSVDVLDASGKKSGTAELPSEIFDVAVNVPLIHQVVVAQRAAARQGTHATKTRGEVRGGGRKPYKQKGTGRARQGSTRAPQFAGGGVVHGPQPRDYSQRTPKKMKAAALRGALSDRARAGRVHVVSGFGIDGTPSTKAALAVIKTFTERAHVLVVTERTDEITIKSLRNVPEVHLLVSDQLNTYDVLLADDVIFTQAALDAFLADAPAGKGAKAVATESEAAELSAEAPAAAVDLKKIEGIGPKIAGVLTAAGYTTWEKLAAATEDDVRAALTDGGVKFSPAASSFAKQAQFLADGDEKGLAEFQEYLVGGQSRDYQFTEKVDFTDVDEIESEAGKADAIAADAVKVAEAEGAEAEEESK
ncbi:hypothetical protein GCM10009751_03550 [Myceligenerans crystallogenes]|uniref:Large ribosomal subunit protein uL4 n=1 Tax=Myceligenerans crystallogenes TaxID=316335 RepID=A0ABP4ZEN2_9MICO